MDTGISFTTGQIVALLLLALPVMALLASLVSRNVARIVGATLMAHADALDAYRERFSCRASHWFSQAVEREESVVLQLERRAVGDRS